MGEREDRSVPVDDLGKSIALLRVFGIDAYRQVAELLKIMITQPDKMSAPEQAHSSESVLLQNPTYQGDHHEQEQSSRRPQHGTEH